MQADLIFLFVTIPMAHSTSVKTFLKESTIAMSVQLLMHSVSGI